MCEITLDSGEILKRIDASQVAKEIEEEDFDFVDSACRPNNSGIKREEYIKQRINVLEASINEYKQELKELKQLYYIKIIDFSNGYLNVDLTDVNWEISSKEETNSYKTKFTKEEIMDFDERLWAFAIPEEEGNE